MRSPPFLRRSVTSARSSAESHPTPCCAVCCCDPIMLGQLYERAAQKGLLARLPMFSCMSIAVFLCAAPRHAP